MDIWIGVLLASGGAIVYAAVSFFFFSKKEGKQKGTAFSNEGPASVVNNTGETRDIVVGGGVTNITNEIKEQLSELPDTLVFPPKPQLLWALSIAPYGSRGGSNSFVTMRGPFPTDRGEVAYRAKTSGTRYQYLVVSEESAIERFVQYALDNLDIDFDKDIHLLDVGIGSYQATDREDGLQSIRDPYSVYSIKVTEIIDSDNVALSASLNKVDDEKRTRDFSRANLKAELKKFAILLCREHLRQIMKEEN